MCVFRAHEWVKTMSQFSENDLHSCAVKSVAVAMSCRAVVCKCDYVIVLYQLSTLCSDIAQQR